MPRKRNKIIQIMDPDKEPTTPVDLQQALEATPSALVAWHNLTSLARRDFISWIESAKQLETRQRRIARACQNLVAGKRRPCCYAVVPMDLYKALGANPEAKAKWSGLSANQKRDFSDSIESAQDRRTRQERIDEVLSQLSK